MGWTVCLAGRANTIIRADSNPPSGIMADPKQVQRLKKSVEDWNEWRRQQARDFEPDLTRAGLNNHDLTGADLSNANLAKAELGAAVLKGCDLRGANLSDAYLVSADLEGARGAGARILRARLRGANLKGAVLVSADFSEAALAGACLEGANLTGANLTEANLTGADLSQANLSGANLQDAEAPGARFVGARMRKALLAGADLQKATLDGASLVGAKCQRTQFAAASCISTDLRNIEGRNADFTGADLQRADLRNADLGRAVLISADLRACNLDGTILREGLADLTTKWPDGFDAREALGANEAARLDAERRQMDTEPLVQDSARLIDSLAEVEGLNQDEAQWIAGQFTLDADGQDFEVQRQAIADSDLADSLEWMESVFENKLSAQEIEASLDAAKRLRSEEARIDQELMLEIRSLPVADRENLERIDKLRRQLRDWSWDLPDELVGRMLDQIDDEGKEHAGRE